MYAIAYSDMLVGVLNGNDLRSEVEKCHAALSKGNGGRHVSMREIVDRSKADPMVACYIESSFPALLFLLYKYGDSVEQAILGNANAGGENVARGSLLGAVVGAAFGMEAFPQWTHELKSKEEIMAEINAFINLPSQSL